MQYHPLLVAGLFLASSTFAQPRSQFVLTQGELLDRCASDGSTTDLPKKVPVDQGWRFTIERKVGTDYVIHFLPWSYDEALAKDTRQKDRVVAEQLVNKQNAELNSNYSYHDDGAGTRTPVYYLLPIAALDGMTEPYFVKGFQVGTVILPIKVRFGGSGEDPRRRFDFTSEVNLGLSAGYSWRISRGADSRFSIMGGISITSIPVDSASTHGIVREETKASALTPFLGTVFAHEGFQNGIFTGMDMLAKELGQEWTYRNSPWLGIGLGFSIVQLASKTQGDSQ